MKPIFKLFSALLLCVISCSLSAADCEMIVNKISYSIQKHPDDFPAQDFPWEDISWLHEHLGQGKSDPQNPLEITWSCSAQTYLTATVDQNNNLVQVEGAYSSPQGAGVFSEKIPPRPNHPQPVVKDQGMTMHMSKSASKADVALATDQAVLNYKTWFNMKVPKDRLVIVTKKMLSSFYEKLKICKPGKYQFPTFNSLFRERLEDGKLQPMLTLGSADISGFKEGKCDMTITTNTAEPARLHTCEFTKADLDFLIKMELGYKINSSKHPSQMEKFNQIMAEACPR